MHSFIDKLGPPYDTSVSCGGLFACWGQSDHMVLFVANHKKYAKKVLLMTQRNELYYPQEVFETWKNIELSHRDI